MQKVIVFHSLCKKYFLSLKIFKPEKILSFLSESLFSGDRSFRVWGLCTVHIKLTVAFLTTFKILQTNSEKITLFLKTFKLAKNIFFLEANLFFRWSVVQSVTSLCKNWNKFELPIRAGFSGGGGRICSDSAVFESTNSEFLLTLIKNL